MTFVTDWKRLGRPVPGPMSLPEAPPRSQKGVAKGTFSPLFKKRGVGGDLEACV